MKISGMQTRSKKLLVSQSRQLASLSSVYNAHLGNAYAKTGHKKLAWPLPKNDTQTNGHTLFKHLLFFVEKGFFCIAQAVL